MGNFVRLEQDSYVPYQGDINWKPRLNARLEKQEAELTPIGYYEAGKSVMQVNQDNTIIYINHVADELDTIAVQYDEDPQDCWTWHWPEKFESDEDFRTLVATLGIWACRIVTLYPQDHVVEQYIATNTKHINFVPADWT